MDYYGHACPHGDIYFLALYFWIPATPTPRQTRRNETKKLWGGSDLSFQFYSSLQPLLAKLSIYYTDVTERERD